MFIDKVKPIVGLGIRIHRCIDFKNLYSTRVIANSKSNQTNRCNFSQYKALPPTLVTNLNQQFARATLVQDHVLQLLNQKMQNLRIQSSTGSGKTLSYLVYSLVPILKGLSPFQLKYGKECSLLIVVPSRELVLQTNLVAKRLCKGLPLQVLSLVGGLSRKEDLVRIHTKRVDIVIATPGRLVDLLTNSVLFRQQLTSLKVLVLDEADKLSGVEHIHKLKVLLKNLPSTNPFQTVVCSATLPHLEDNGNLVNQLLRKKPFHNVDLTQLKPKPNETENQQTGQDQDQGLIDVPKVSHNYIVSNPKLQLSLLYALILQFIQTNPKSKCILFLNTKVEVDVYFQLFSKLNICCIPLHSNLTQLERQANSQTFQTQKVRLLLTTDLTSRGLDFTKVDLVLQLGAPNLAETFVHRVGRTGRAGLQGKSILLLHPMELPILNHLQTTFPNLKLNQMEVEEVEKPTQLGLLQLHLATNPFQKSKVLKQMFQSKLSYYLSLSNRLKLKRGSITKLCRLSVETLGYLPGSKPKLDKNLSDPLDRMEKLIVNKRSSSQ